MPQIVTQDDERAGRAIQDSLGVTVALPFVGLVVTEGDKLVAALIFNNFDRINIDLSISAFAPLSIRAIREIAKYVFGLLRVKRVTCITRISNTKAIDRLLTLGFEFEARLKQRFPDEDGLQFCLLRSSQKLVRKHEYPASPRPLRDRSGSDQEQ